jgi:hypothetical protein
VVDLVSDSEEEEEDEEAMLARAIALSKSSL